MTYLAYGSNLHPHRLSRRIPSARLIGITRLQGLRLQFNKRSFDGSAKCTFLETGASRDILHGVVYEIDADEKRTLDDIEGLGRGYDEKKLRVQLEDCLIEPFTYIAANTHITPDLQPYHWYKELVLLGARYHQLPREYTATIEAVVSVPDPDSSRMQDRQILLDAMQAINSASSR